MGKLIDRLLIKVLDLDRLNRVRASQNLRAGLTYQFPDENGLKWYTFTDPETFPLSRLAAQQTALRFLQAGLSAKEYKDSMDTVIDLLDKGETVKAGAVIMELHSLPDKVLTLDALVNVIASYYVREDEEPSVHSDAIHAQKCNWIKSQVEDGGFFFRHPSLIASLAALGLSSRASVDSLAACLKQGERLARLLTAARSMTEPKQ
jgi:hypothetical protein